MYSLSVDFSNVLLNAIFIQRYIGLYLLHMKVIKSQIFFIFKIIQKRFY